MCKHVLCVGVSASGAGWSAFHWAASDGSAQLVRFYLARSMYAIDVRDTEAHSSWTALHWAASRGHTEVAEVLLKHGADPNLDDKQKRSVRMVAEQKRQRAVTVLLDQHARCSA